MKEVKSLQLDTWMIVYTRDMLFIGCKGYAIDEFFSLSDEEINRMDPYALEWWRTRKEIIKTIIENFPAN